MNEFKLGQIVYCKDRKGDGWSLCHYVDYEPEGVHPYSTNASYEAAMQGLESILYDECLSIEDYYKMLSRPKDKDLVWSWTAGSPFARYAKFYDGKNNATFSSVSGDRNGWCFDYYEVIKDWRNKPDFAWAIDVFKQLED